MAETTINPTVERALGTLQEVHQAMIVRQPSPEARKAIAEFVKTGAWPKPGTLPVCIRLGGR